MRTGVWGTSIGQNGSDECPVKQYSAISVLESSIANMFNKNDPKNAQIFRPIIFL